MTATETGGHVHTLETLHRLEPGSGFPMSVMRATGTKIVFAASCPGCNWIGWVDLTSGQPHEDVLP